MTELRPKSLFRLRGRRALASLAIVVLGAGAIGAAAALAGGGSSVSGATAITVGQHEFGNTNDALNNVGACDHDTNDPADYWTLTLIAGDHVTIDWASQLDPGSNPAASDLVVYPPGTTDFSITNTNDLQCFQIGSNNHKESVFSANNDGVYPLIFVDANSGGGPGSGGPYDFTATVLHKPVITFTPPRAVSSGSAMKLSAFYPDGKPIASGLLMGVYGRWLNKNHLLGSSSVTGGTATVLVRLPSSQRGQKIAVFAYASGGGFIGTRTPFHRVTVR